MQVLTAGDARVELAPEAGGRIASIEVRGRELLVTHPTGGPLRWGLFPMVPFAGRIRHGEFTFDDRSYRLPRNLGSHAIHGTLLETAWELAGDARMVAQLAPPWPFAGAVEHRLHLEPGSLRATLTVTAEERMPVSVGWHPWWRREVDGVAAEVDLDAAAMYEKDDEKIPTGRIVEPAPPPWDDCFTALKSPPVVTWPGFLSIVTESSTDHFVAYTSERNGVCVEPQTAPPDAVNLGAATVLEPGERLVASATWRWERGG